MRLVRVLDPERRKELMIIYSEDLAPTGVKVDNLMPGGRDSEKWLAIQKCLVERAEQKIHLIAQSRKQ